MKKLLLALALTGLVACSQPAGYEEGMKARNRGDFVTALKVWRPLAEQGHAEAQYALGMMCFYGLGVQQSYTEAVTWYRLAAEQGYPKAQNHLGVMYLDGLEVARDHEEAVKLFRLAADQKFSIAVSNLGNMYEIGMVVKKNQIAAYALNSLAVAIDPNDENSRNSFDNIKKKKLSTAEIEAAEVLEREMEKPGNLLKALDAYLEKHQ